MPDRRALSGIHFQTTIRLRKKPLRRHLFSSAGGVRRSDVPDPPTVAGAGEFRSRGIPDRVAL
jgi:hypothetical protein